MPNRHFQSRGFTLIELILVMVIIAIITAIAMPSLSAFSAGRSASNTATQLVSLANYARNQSAAEGRTYRLNFDPNKGTYWLTAQYQGSFAPPANEYGQQFKLPPGVQWDINVSSKVATQLTVLPDETQVTTQMQDSLSQPRLQQNYMLQNTHQNGAYIAFDADGRSDPATIKLTDTRNGGVIEVASLSATEMFHILSREEMTK